jgi:hypothetical protein
MRIYKYVLLADGSSDKTLIFIIDWLLRDLYPTYTFHGEFADFRHFKIPPKTLQQRILTVKKMYELDLLFIHRDGEELISDKEIIEKRKLEIEDALSIDLKDITIPIIPIKMMETWLLINENAIRKAAGNRNSRIALNIPPLNKLESIPQPKDLLKKIISDASELNGRNLKKLNLNQAIHNLAEYIEDYQSLRSLQSFQVFENDTSNILSNFFKSH